MDLGSLVVDLVSLVIVASVFAIALVQTTTPSPDERILLSDDLAERGYYGSNPSEAEDAAREA